MRCVDVFILLIRVDVKISTFVLSMINFLLSFITSRHGPMFNAVVHRSVENTKSL